MYCAVVDVSESSPNAVSRRTPVEHVRHVGRNDSFKQQLVTIPVVAHTTRFDRGVRFHQEIPQHGGIGRCAAWLWYSIAEIKGNLVA